MAKKLSRKVEKRKSKIEHASSFNLTHIDEKWLVVLIALVAVVFRIIYFYQLRSASPVYSRLIHDSALFNELAHRVLKNGLVLKQPFYISPLYIYFLAFVYKVFGDTINTVRFIQFLMGVGTSLMTFCLAGYFFDKKTAFIAGLMAAVYAPFLFMEGNLLGTSAATFFLLASVLLLVLSKTNRPGFFSAFASGLLLSLAICGRPNLILLIPVPILYFVLKRQKTTTLVLFNVLGILLPLLLTGAHNQLAGGQFTILTTHGGINFYIGNNEKATGVWQAPEGIEASVSAINLQESKSFAEKALGKKLTLTQVSKFWYKRAISFIIKHPLKWMVLTVKKFLLFWSSYETPLNFDYYFHQHFSSLLRLPLFNLLFYMPLALFGLIVFAPKWKKVWLLYAVIVLACFSVVMFFMADRYRIVVLPFLIIIAAAGVVRLFSMFSDRNAKKWLFVGILIVLFAVETAYAQKRISKTNFANDYYNLSLSHLIENDIRGAVYWGQRAVAADPSDKNAHYNLGIAYLKEKENEKAFAQFSEVVRIDSTAAGAQRNLGALLLMQKRYASARRHLQASLRFDPDNSMALMNLGLAHYYLGDYQNAIRAWKDLLGIEPQNEQAKNNIKAAQAALGR